MLIARRTFLAAATLTAVPTASWARDLSAGSFTHGVASGDPLPDGVIIWTRFVSSNGGRIGWEVAEDENFTRIVRRGAATAAFATDFCVKADVRGLQPGQRYFYRFVSGSGPSQTGRTRTAPAGAIDSVTFAFFSCSNYGFGYFHAYGHAAQREDVDLVLHVGDYIYEGQRGSYPSDADTVAGRAVEPIVEIVHLADYYARYGQYHTDPDLQELRRLKPMSVIWDDHELANDANKDGAQNHQPETEGSWTDRVAAASKAYFDWMPIRRPDPRGPRIYRSFDWGNLARFVMLDTRYIGRDPQLDYRTTLLPALQAPGADGAALARTFRAEFLDNPNRTMMGPAQERWFADTLAQSKQRGQPWQVVAQQVVMGEQLAAHGVSRLLPESLAPSGRAYFENGERVGALGLPWNLDSWGGYPAARERFLAACTANANNAIVLGGDSHNCWINNLPSADGRRLAAIEFAGGSVSSPGFERSLTNAQPGQRESVIRAGNPNLAWCDMTRRGYGAVKLTREACEAQWVAFDNVRVPTAGPPAVSRLVSAASASAGPGAWSVAG